MTIEGVRVLRALDATARGFGPDIDRLGPRARHRLRKHIKTLRYNAETLRGFVPYMKASHCVDDLARLQNLLGDLNDVEAGRRLGRRFHDLTGVTTDPGTRATVKSRREDLRQAWRHYLRNQPAWSRWAGRRRPPRRANPERTFDSIGLVLAFFFGDNRAPPRVGRRWAATCCSTCCFTA